MVIKKILSHDMGTNWNLISCLFRFFLQHNRKKYEEKNGDNKMTKKKLKNLHT